VACSQGFEQLVVASQEYKWDLNLGLIATIWRGGCMIRAAFLDRIREGYEAHPDADRSRPQRLTTASIAGSSVRRSASSSSVCSARRRRSAPRQYVARSTALGREDGNRWNDQGRIRAGHAATAPAIATIGADLISIGWITHSAPFLDIDMNYQ
jgi:hypothetical protein